MKCGVIKPINFFHQRWKIFFAELAHHCWINTGGNTAPPSHAALLLFPLTIFSREVLNGTVVSAAVLSVYFFPSESFLQMWHLSLRALSVFSLWSVNYYVLLVCDYYFPGSLCFTTQQCLKFLTQEDWNECSMSCLRSYFVPRVPFQLIRAVKSSELKTWGPNWSYRPFFSQLSKKWAKPS